MANFKIESEGTVASTKVYVDGKEITSEGNVLSARMGVDGGYSYDGEKRPPSLDFSYRQLVEENGGKTIKEFSFMAPKSSKWESHVIPSKSADATSYVGQPNQMIESIMKYAGKATYVPTREELNGRSEESLRDLLADLEKEFGK